MIAGTVVDRVLRSYFCHRTESVEGGLDQIGEGTIHRGRLTLRYAGRDRSEGESCRHIRPDRPGDNVLSTSPASGAAPVPHRSGGYDGRPAAVRRGVLCGRRGGAVQLHELATTRCQQSSRWAALAVYWAGLMLGGEPVEKRLCAACGQERPLRGGAICANGRFVCHRCPYRGSLGGYSEVGPSAVPSAMSLSDRSMRNTRRRRVARQLFGPQRFAAWNNHLDVLRGSCGIRLLRAEV